MTLTKHNARLATVRLISIAVDLLTIGLVFAAVTLARKVAGGDFDLNQYFRLWPFLIIFWAVFEKTGLYNGTSIHAGASIGPVEEIRRIFYATAVVFIAIGFSNYCYRPGNYLYSRGILIGTFFLSVIFLPLNRILLRKILMRFNLWGMPAIVIGSGSAARQIFKTMQQRSEYGLIPVGFFTDSDTHDMPADATCLGTIDDLEAISAAMGIRYVILAKDSPPDTPAIQQLIRRCGSCFPHLLIIPPGFTNSCSGVSPKDIGGTLGLEIRNNLQIASIYRIKRIMDYLFMIPIFIATLPLMGLIALWVKLDSPGPVFFKHRRVAKNGNQINIYKFRTMADGAADTLDGLITADRTLKDEWETYGKLQNDPRITKAGAWLRKTSLDELPQLFNVFQGKLTLVGPRPLVQKELKIYGEAAALFDRVKPGLTGLWQVSGRNNLTYEERARMDLYYVNNWSVWLDIYILAKTVYAVLFRHGAR
jgi:Undecaprenyl-phosphate galactose phosphotransferase WbaP